MGILIHRTHRLHPIKSPEDVGALRRAVSAIAATQPQLGAGEAELVATELGTNLLRHASPGGYVLFRPTAEGVELISVDSGPGMNSGNSRGPGSPSPEPSTSGLRAGLPSILRRATDHDCYSNAQGTVTLARLGGSGRETGTRWSYGAINVPLGGSGPSGDSWAVRDDRLLAALLIDGLGHGEEAAVAAQAAVDSFNGSPFGDPAAFLRRAHEAMRGTRGAVAGTCVIDAENGQLIFAGVGNIAGEVIHGAQRQHLISHPGTLGTHLAPPRLQTRNHVWPSRSTLIMCTDGIHSGWGLSAYPGLLDHDPTVIAAVLHRDFTRSTDDATVLVVRDVS